MITAVLSYPRFFACFFALASACVTPAISLTASKAAHLNFQLSTDPATTFGEVVTFGKRRIFITGTIAAGDTDRFLQFLRLHHLQDGLVVLNSPGGALMEGLKLGGAIRKLGFDTEIGRVAPNAGSRAICASACAYTFAGGVRRYLDDDTGKLGIHQFKSASGVSEGEAQLVSGLLVSYLREMGVDPEAFALAAATSPDGITWLSHRDAQKLGFADTGLRTTTADIRTIGMRPYLRLNQEQAALTIRVLLACEAGSISMQAGIVTDPEQSRDIAAQDWQKRSYVEFDGREDLVVDGASGARANDSTAWLPRTLSRAQSIALLATNQLGVWIDGFGAVRAGGTIDLKAVRPQVNEYVKQCLA